MGVCGEARASPAGWTLGVDAIDRALPGGGLEVAGLHEIKPPAAGDWACNHAAALGFMLRLLARRALVPALVPAPPVARLPAPPAKPPAMPVLCCWPGFQAFELGGLYGAGLAALGVDPSLLLIAETANTADALWAMEEGLKSGALSAVAGLIDEVALTPARRLALAAREHATPCLLLTHPRGSPAGPALTRWRAGPAPGARHCFDAGEPGTPAAPGARRFALTLERCRHGRGSAPGSAPGAALTLEHVAHIVEWSDEAHCFHLAAGLADRTAETSLPRYGAG